MEDKLKGSYKHPRDWNYELRRNDELQLYVIFSPRSLSSCRCYWKFQWDNPVFVMKSLASGCLVFNIKRHFTIIVIRKNGCHPFPNCAPPHTSILNTHPRWFWCWNIDSDHQVFSSPKFEITLVKWWKHSQSLELQTHRCY